MKKKLDHFHDLLDEEHDAGEDLHGDQDDVETIDMMEEATPTASLPSPEGAVAIVPALRDVSLLTRGETVVADAIDPGETGVPKRYAQPIYEMLCSGFTPGQTSVMLLQAENVYVEPDKVRAYRLLIPEEYFLPQTALRRHFFNINVISDPIAELQLLLRLEQERLSHELHSEQGGEHLSRTVQAHINSYWRKLLQFAQLKGEMGLAKGAVQQQSEPERHKLPTIADIIGAELAKRQLEINIRAPTPGDVVEGEIVEHA